MRTGSRCGHLGFLLTREDEPCRSGNVLAIAFAVAWLGLALLGCSTPTLRKVYTEHLGQLTFTRLNPLEPLAMTGTDLGVSFVEAAPEQRLIFLFGDSWTKDRARWDQDSAAWTSPKARPDVLQVPKLTWYTSGGHFSALRIPVPKDREADLKANNVPVDDGAVDSRGMNVPVEGLAIGGHNYVFAVTGYNEDLGYCCSVLAHTAGAQFDPTTLVLDHAVNSARFLNVSAFLEGETVWIFGSGLYRRSSVFLARVSAHELTDRSAWRYYQGMNGSDPVFGPDESTAAHLVPSDCVGELSVRPNPVLGYVMLYNCSAEGVARKYGQGRGVYLHRADSPWGPWESPINIFNPDVDQGYGYFMHRKVSAVGYDDGLAEPSRHIDVSDPEKSDCHGEKWREECWGGEYGPYQVPQWFVAPADGTFEIYYTLSSWVPYQSHLMRTVLAKSNVPRPALPQPKGTGLPRAALVNPDFSNGLAGWTGAGDDFQTFPGDDGRWRVTTYSSAKREAATGVLYQDFTVDSRTKALRFLVHGGDGVIRLYRGTDLLRETRGRSGHAPRNTPETVACWNLGAYAGESLRVSIVDFATGPWGFVGATAFEFLDRPCEGSSSMSRTEHSHGRGRF